MQEQTEQNHGEKWTFKTADGEIIENNPKLPVPPPNRDDKDYFETQWPDINDKTGVPDWRGDDLNYPKALRDLFWAKHQKKRGFNY